VTEKHLMFFANS